MRALTLLTPFHLLDLVHGALEDVALVGLDAEAGNVAHVGRQQLRQLLDVAALQLPSPLLQTAEKNTDTDTPPFLHNVLQLIISSNFDLLLLIFSFNQFLRYSIKYCEHVHHLQVVQTKRKMNKSSQLNSYKHQKWTETNLLLLIFCQFIFSPILTLK